MMRFPIAGVVLLVTVAVVSRCAAQQREPVSPDRPMANAPVAEAPTSIFNERIRRFRFELEETLVTSETAEQFMLLHQARNEPPILGAYADSEANALIVVGPPEAEQLVRETLAKWMVDRQGVAPPRLNVQRRMLEFRREELLCSMAGVELQLVAAGGDQAKQLQARLRTFEDELTVVEKQMEVVDRYVKRLHGKEASTVARTRDTATER